MNEKTKLTFEAILKWNSLRHIAIIKGDKKEERRAIKNLNYHLAKLDLPRFIGKQRQICGNERPSRKTFCQLKRGHKGSHRAVIFWEDE